MTFITKQNSFESGNPSGTAMTAGSGGNTGGTAGDWLANVFAASGGGALFTSDSYSGSLAGLARLVASTGTTFGFRTTVLGHTDIYVRGYFKFDALPPQNLFLVTARDNATANSGFSIRMSTAGVLSVYKRTLTTATLASLATPCAVGTWYLLQAHFTAAGDWELRVRPAASWTPLAAPVSGTGVSTGLTFFDFLNFGGELASGTGTMDIVWDEIAYGSDWLGPILAGDARPIETTASANMTATGLTTLEACAADASDSTYGLTGTLSATASYQESRVSNLAAGSVKFRTRILASATPGVTAVITLRQGASVIATRTVTDVPTSATTYEYTCDPSTEEPLITDREDLRVRTSFTV